MGNRRGSYGSVADRLLGLLVVTHEPTESYEVDDFLRRLDDGAPPPTLSSVPLWKPGQGMDRSDPRISGTRCFVNAKAPIHSADQNVDGISL